MDHLQGDKAFLAIDNQPHTWVSQKHLAAWRMWLMHSFEGRKIPKVRTSFVSSKTELNLSATVDFEGDIEHIKLYCAYNPITDWRFSRWESQDMTPGEGKYTGLLQRKPKVHLAFYVEVGHNGPGSLGYTTSLVEILRFDQ